MNKQKVLKEALKNMSRQDLSEMKDKIAAVLSRAASEKLEEKKRELTTKYLD